jgi:FimV-like protein
VKLLEIYAKRGDKAAFNDLAEQIRSSVGVAGETWQQVTRLGQDLDSRAGGGNPTELTLGAGLLNTSFEQLRRSSGVGGAAQTPQSAEPGVQPVVAHPVPPDGTIAFEGPEVGAGPALRAGDGAPPPDLARMPNLDLDLSIGPDVSPTPAPPAALEIPAMSLTLDEAPPAPASQADPGVDASEPIVSGSEAAPATEVSSIVAAEMATKLDLARGYVDLGVKDGASELLAEVQRGGTPEQRAAALELLRRIG